ncbi:type II toxin-antitoxin system Phd/YefM family antitoxin [Enterovirga sp. CN4-39]|uniref:type II toxin-antitoxin system Phd/YefM family antitoxin n=1 Tax=Enterovirga sp. CN4-39 TaxID=3400910 RepID=UPI003BFBB8E2
MRTVGIKVLEGRLSEYVRAAEAGETVLVTDHDRVVAELGPPRRLASDPSVEAIREQGRREGWLTPAKRDWREPLPDRGPPPADDPDIPFEQLMADLARDREDR